MPLKTEEPRNAEKEPNSGTDRRTVAPDRGIDRTGEDARRGLPEREVSEQTCYRQRLGVWRSATGRGDAFEGLGEGEPAAEKAGGGSQPVQGDARRVGEGILLSPERCGQASMVLRERFGVCERQLCRRLFWLTNRACAWRRRFYLTAEAKTVHSGPSKPVHLGNVGSLFDKQSHIDTPHMPAALRPESFHPGGIRFRLIGQAAFSRSLWSRCAALLPKNTVLKFSWLVLLFNSTSKWG